MSDFDDFSFNNIYDDLWNDANSIMPKLGDFSFIVNETISTTLTYDYNKLNNYDLWGLLEKKNKKILKASVCVFYNKHTPESLKHNITFLKHIYTHGWAEFVIKCLNV
jgi:hypothetical protein